MTSAQGREPALVLQPAEPMIGEGEYLAGVLLGDDGDVDAVFAEWDDGAAFLEGVREARGVVSDAVERAEPQDKA